MLIIGGVILNIVTLTQIAGSINSWGSIIGYVGSYYHNKDPSMSLTDFAIVAFISYIAECLSTLLLSVLFHIFSPMFIIFLGASRSSIILFLTSYIENPIVFCWTYGISLGLLSGTVFLPSMIVLWEKLRTNKGTTSGILLAGYSMGSGVVGLLFSYIINPHNYSADIVEYNGVETVKYFGTDITEAVPASLRWTAVFYFIVTIVGLFLLNTKSDAQMISKSEVKVSRTITFGQMMKNRTIWYYFILMFFGLASTSYIMVTYKIIGVTHINDDHFLAFVGTAMFVISSAGRLIFGILFDLFSYKKIMITCYLFNTVQLLLLEFCLDNRFLFGLMIILIGFTSTSVYNGIVLQIEKTFPRDKWLLSVVWLGAILDFYLPYLAEEFITPKIGYFYTFAIFSGFAFISFVLVLMHSENLTYKEKLIE